jgi:hypothetical protein
MTTHSGLTDPAKAAQQKDAAAAETLKDFGSLDVPLGKVMRFQMNDQSAGTTTDPNVTRTTPINGADSPANVATETQASSASSPSAHSIPSLKPEPRSTETATSPPSSSPPPSTPAFASPTETPRSPTRPSTPTSSPSSSRRRCEKHSSPAVPWKRTSAARTPSSRA